MSLIEGRVDSCACVAELGVPASSPQFHTHTLTLTLTLSHRFHALTEQILSAPAVPNPHTPYTQAALDTDAAFNQTPPPYLSSWLMALSPKRLVRVLWAFGSCAHFVTWRQPELAAALEHAVRWICGSVSQPASLL